MDERHVVPAASDPEHDLSGLCWCQPIYEDVVGLPGGRLFIHRRSLDSPHIERDVCKCGAYVSDPSGDAGCGNCGADYGPDDAA